MSKPVVMYKRCINDIFVLCIIKDEAIAFHHLMNNLHKDIKFELSDGFMRYETALPNQLKQNVIKNEYERINNLNFAAITITKIVAYTCLYILNAAGNATSSVFTVKRGSPLISLKDPRSGLNLVSSSSNLAVKSSLRYSH